ncbi:MAG: acyl--CoA ligase [Deltaproteobacteria bacterium]|nr:acyl--CoA ligase [Deltaproteobacteria bacterium]
MSLLYEWLEAAVQGRTAAGGSGHAIVYHDTYLSWRGLLHRVERRARELVGMGIQGNDWVGLMLGNDPEFIVLTLALAKLGAVVVPIDPTTGSRDLDMTLEAVPLRAIVTRPNAVDPLAAPSGALRMAGQAPQPRIAAESRHRISGTLLTCSLYPWTPPATEHGVPALVALVTLDAGGDPKVVVRDAANLRGIAATLGAALGLGPGENVLAAAPLFDCQGFDLGFLAALAHGATLFLDDGTAGPRLAKILVDQTIALYAATPREFAALSRITHAKPIARPSARLLCSGVPLPEAIARAFLRRFGVPALSCYQSCETGPAAIDLEGSSPDSVGKPLPGVEIRVASAAGAPLPDGSTGPVWARGPGVASRFLPALPARRGQIAVGRGRLDGWLRTGDVGRFDADGRLHLSHREDDLVSVDRKRVALGEIESCLESRSEVKAAQALVEYDDSGSTQIVVRITPSGRCKANAMLDHCARRLAPYKVPRRIEIAD